MKGGSAVESDARRVRGGCIISLPYFAATTREQPRKGSPRDKLRAKHEKSVGDWPLATKVEDVGKTTLRNKNEASFSRQITLAGSEMRRPLETSHQSWEKNERREQNVISHGDTQYQRHVEVNKVGRYAMGMEQATSTCL